MNEKELIQHISSVLRLDAPEVVGMGDDTAVVYPGHGPDDLLLASDPVVEGVHFRRDADLQQVGHKAVARNLSDIAAMGGSARWLLTNLSAPADLSEEALKSLYEGMRDTAAQAGAFILGGDTSKGSTLAVHVFIVGTVPHGQAVLRSGAGVGDALYVTGRLGDSLSGRHLTFTPRLAEGRWLRSGQWASAMIDISDGLSTEIHHLSTASRTGFHIRAELLPLQESLNALEREEALRHALTDGEDFELLFTVPAEKCKAFEQAWACDHDLLCTCIGEAVPASEGVVTVAGDGTLTPLPAGGYDHLAEDVCG